MQEFFNDPVWVSIILFLAGIAAYIISTLSGGGGALLLVPVINFFIGGKATAPVVNLGNLIGEPVRIFYSGKILNGRSSNIIYHRLLQGLCWAHGSFPI